jgi:hypothetical protein
MVVTRGGVVGFGLTGFDWPGLGRTKRFLIFEFRLCGAVEQSNRAPVLNRFFIKLIWLLTLLSIKSFSSREIVEGGVGHLRSYPNLKFCADG